MFGKEKKDKKPKSKAKKVIDWVITGVLATFIVGIAVIQIVNKTSGSQNLFGSMYQKVLTDSMEPVYKVDDVIVVKDADPADIKEKFDEGKNVDVSFKWNVSKYCAALLNDNSQYVVSMTHRLVEVIYSDVADTDPITGETYHYTFKAHGINTESNFCKVGEKYGDCTNQYQLFHEGSLIGKVERKSYFMTFATSTWGLLVLILIPCLYLITVSVIDICKALDKREEESENGQNKDPLAGLSEKDKKRLKKQMLNDLLGNKK